MGERRQSKDSINERVHENGKLRWGKGEEVNGMERKGMTQSKMSLSLGSALFWLLYLAMINSSNSL